VGAGVGVTEGEVEAMHAQPVQSHPYMFCRSVHE
jgi:hypothetical protein